MPMPCRLANIFACNSNKKNSNGNNSIPPDQAEMYQISMHNHHNQKIKILKSTFSYPLFGPG